MYDFLDNFQNRMKNISASALLHKSVVYKDTLSSTFGFTEYDEQLNLIYALLKYIMDKSLKEEDCTLDDMAIFLEEINLEYFKKDIKRETYVKLANFIVNEIVLNDGNMTFFKCLNPEKKDYSQIYVQLIGHKRTEDSNMATYYLTEQGYNLLLSTLEFEDNMKLTVQELIFKINLENKDYDKALADVKNIFALSKKQVQSLLDNITRIKENIMTFTAEDYEKSVNYSLHLQASLLKWGLLFSTLFATTEVAKQFTRWWDTQTTSDHTIPRASWASCLPVDRLKVLRRKPVPYDNSILSSFQGSLAGTHGT